MNRQSIGERPGIPAAVFECIAAGERE